MMGIKDEVLPALRKRFDNSLITEMNEGDVDFTIFNRGMSKIKRDSHITCVPLIRSYLLK